MCRLAAFPPNYPRAAALNILRDFEAQNTDGTGYTYIKDGKFVTRKWPTSFSKLIRNGKGLLAHMPHPGWTIAHLRAASHGGNTMQNTHPFEIGKDWAICHNGVWSEYSVAKLALSKYEKFIGETDSEVAGHLINNIGPKKFARSLNDCGVYLALNIDGSLWVIKTNGDLVLNTLKNEQVLIASELSYQKFEEQRGALDGWYHFDEKGFYKSNKVNTPWYMKNGQDTRDSNFYSNYNAAIPYSPATYNFSTGGSFRQLDDADYNTVMDNGNIKEGLLNGKFD